MEMENLTFSGSAAALGQNDFAGMEIEPCLWYANDIWEHTPPCYIMLEYCDGALFMKGE